MGFNSDSGLLSQHDLVDWWIDRKKALAPGELAAMEMRIEDFNISDADSSVIAHEGILLDLLSISIVSYR